MVLAMLVRGSEFANVYMQTQMQMAKLERPAGCLSYQLDSQDAVWSKTALLADLPRCVV